MADQSIWTPVVHDDKLSKNFKIMLGAGHEAARNMINKAYESFSNADPDFVQQFQTSGFDARLWELYLHMYLSSSFKIINQDQVDFGISVNGKEIYIEAVTSNPGSPEVHFPENAYEEVQITQGYLPIKFDSALNSKLEKEYWERANVKNNPLIFAIHEYSIHANNQSPASTVFSNAAIWQYLYGTAIIHDEKYPGSYFNIKIGEHKFNNKSCDSCFFGRDEARHISAILFSNAATSSKFNRMGKISGLGGDNVDMIRYMYKYNPNDNEKTPIGIVSKVSEDNYRENWGDELVMFHNPNAIHPVEKSLFSNISHVFYDKESKKVDCDFIDSYVILSLTNVMLPKDK